MATLGRGDAHGACSLLHAAGLNMGASLALDLPVTVRLRDNEPKKELEDPDGLLNAVLEAWKGAGHPLPDGELFWSVRSSVPPRQGLKSSAAVGIAALRALCDANDMELETTELIDMCVTAQISSGVSITGSADDAWAVATEGWKLVDPAVPAAEGILLQDDGPDADTWDILIVLRGPREQRPEPDAFAWHQQGFQQALQALQNGDALVALTWNGRSMVGVLNDPIGRRLTNDAFINGARAAGISGSGSAIVVFSPSLAKPTLERLKVWYKSRATDTELIITKLLNPEVEEPIETEE